VVNWYLVKASDGIQKLLADFIFRDCRLASHPKVFRSVVYFPLGDSHLDLVACVSSQPIPFEVGRLSIDGSFSGMVWSRREARVTSDLRLPDALQKSQHSTEVLAQSALAVPLGDAAEAIGVLTLLSSEKGYFRREDVGRVQLLAALIAFTFSGARKDHVATEASYCLGRALATVRGELGLTQAELAYRGGLHRIALSQWERGRWPPSVGPIYQWCAALGIVSEDDTPQVSFLDVTPQLLVLLRDNPGELRNLSPERFEHVVAERIDRMGYDVQLTGATTRRDGGIDLIAVPKIRTLGSFLLAAQIKHHRGDRHTGRQDVDRLLAWKDSDFRVGVMVTNTAFTKDARWLADQANSRAFLRLRDFEDLKRWLRDQFDAESDWRELPDVISLAPGITVEVPKATLRNASRIWPLSDVKLVDDFRKG
jgi:transcriptional regulator with XRE-family HTH domain